MPDSQLVWTALFVGGCALAVAAIVRGIQGVRLLFSGTRTTGALTRYTAETHRQWKGEGEGSEDVTLHFPHVAFTLPDGTSVEFRSRLQHMFGPQAVVGSPVPVLYDPRDPAGTAELAGPRAWLTVLGRVGPFAVLAVVLIVYSARAKGWLP